ncbi:MAG: MerR family transcriptional regulator [Dehalococcoidia bacterium]
MLTIGAVSRHTGLPVRTIRFYEAEGVIPAVGRGRSGYRLYTPADVRRLLLVKNARVLGLGLPEVRTLVEQAFASDCHSFGPQLRALIDARRTDVKRRVAELRHLQHELDALEQHVLHAECATTPGQLVAECGFCPLIDDEEGEAQMTRPDVSQALARVDAAMTHGGEAMKSPEAVKALAVLGCDLNARPASAPTFEDIVPRLRTVRREPERLTLEFDAAAGADVEAFVAAERRCCSSIAFAVRPGDPTVVQIDATPAEIDALERWMTPQT